MAVPTQSKSDDVRTATLLLARGPVAWGQTAEVLTAENLLVAMRMCEAFDDSAAACIADPPSRAA